MYRTLIALVLFGWFYGLWTSSACAAEAAVLAKEYGSQAEVALHGKIELLGTSTVTVDDAARLAVVRITEVISGPPIVRRFVGRDVTVHLLNPGEAREGDDRIFFAKIWYVGDGLGLTEVGSVDFATVQVSTRELAMEMDKTRSAEMDAALETRIKEAKTIISGRVVAIRPPKTRMLSEHDPEWSEADIEISETLKGSASGKVTIMFPASNDVMWYRVPKPKVSQSGIWLLKTGLTGAISPEQSGISDAGDFLSLSELAHVKRLLGR